MSPEDLFLLGQNCKHRRMQRLLVASLMMELCLKRLEGLQHSPKLKTQKRLLELSATQRSGLFQLQLGVWKDVCWWHWWVQGWYPWWHAGVGPGEPLHISFFGTDWFCDICQEYRSFNRYESPFLFSWQLTNYSQYLHLAKYTTRFMNQQKL